MAENGKIGCDILESSDISFDIILMDLQMPVMDGFEATNLIKNELKIKTPIVAMSANNSESGKKKMFQLWNGRLYF